MAMNEKKLSELVGKDVFTEKGAYCGKVSDVRIDMTKFRVDAISVDSARGSFLSSVVGGKRGVVVPYPMVKAIDDIVIIKHIAGPVPTEEETETSGKKAVAAKR